ncbi:hypothetical protein SAMN04487926_14267, partial [Paraburkholderia steynii]
MDKHKHGEDDKMQTCECFGQAFVVTCEASKAVEPSEAALDYPSPWQQHETFFRFIELDHLEINSLSACGLRRIFARVTLIGKGHFHGFSRCLLDLARQLCHLCP